MLSVNLVQHKETPQLENSSAHKVQHPSSQTEGLQASVQGLSDLSQRCHPTPEHTQHTHASPASRAEESTSPLSAAQSCLAPWLEEPPPAPGAPAGSSTLAARAAGQHPTRMAGNCQHQPGRENHSHYPSRKVSKGHSFPVHLPACPSALLKPEPASCIYGLGVTSSSPGCFNI